MIMLHILCIHFKNVCFQDAILDHGPIRKSLLHTKWTSIILNVMNWFYNHCHENYGFNCQRFDSHLNYGLIAMILWVVVTNLRKISQSHNWNNVSSAIFLQINSGQIVNAYSCKSYDLHTFSVVIWAVLQFAWEIACDWSYSSDNHFVFPDRSIWYLIGIEIQKYEIDYIINAKMPQIHFSLFVDDWTIIELACVHCPQKVKCLCFLPTSTVNESITTFFVWRFLYVICPTFSLIILWQ